MNTCPRCGIPFADVSAWLGHDLAGPECAYAAGLKAIVDKLEKFRDGTPAYIGDAAWHRDELWRPNDMNGAGQVHYEETDDWRMNWQAWFSGTNPAQGAQYPVGECYPTRDAAEAAKESQP